MLRCLFVMTLGASSLFGCEAPRSVPVCEPGNVCTSAQEFAGSLALGSEADPTRGLRERELAGSLALGSEADPTRGLREREPRCVLETRLYGRTPSPDGRCSAQGDDTCRAASVTCAVWGQCRAPRSRDAATRCTWNDTDRDVQAARDPACAGLGTCVATEDADCETSRGCALEGRCKAAGGICVARPEDCKRSELCAALGWCTPTAGGLCRAGGPGDCQKADVCKRQGLCRASQGACIR